MAEATVLKVKESDARKMFEDIGYATATDPESWDKAKLLKSLNSKNVINRGEPDDPELAELKESIISTLEEEGTVELEATAKKHEGNGKAKAGKKGGTPKEAKPKKAKAEAKPAAAKDEYGLREDSLASKAMGVLSARPKPMKEIVEEAGLNDSCYNLMKKMVELGHVVKTDQGFALKKLYKEAKAAKKESGGKEKVKAGKKKASKPKDEEETE